MTAKAIMQECLGDVDKSDNSGMHCIKGQDADSFVCDFGYYFKKHSFGDGPQDDC